jgi:hypothetical protein
LRDRRLVKRFFVKIKQCRQVATRYDKLAANYLAFIQLASIRLWLRINEPRPSKETAAFVGEVKRHFSRQKHLPWIAPCLIQILRVTYQVTIEIEGGRRPACVAEVIGQHYR